MPDAREQTPQRPLLNLIRTLLIAAVFVAGLEAALRHFDWLNPTELPDPYLGFPGTSCLFTPVRDGDAKGLLRRARNKPMYRETAFPLEKKEGEYRVFCIGASTTRSDAFLQPDGSYPAMLEIYLNHLLPEGRRARVINCGGGGMGSIQNIEVLREILDYNPDLVCICPEAGDKNLIPPSPEGLMAIQDDEDPARVVLRRHLNKLRIYVAARELLRELQTTGKGQSGLNSPFSAFFLYTLAKPFSQDTFTRMFEFKRDRVPVLMPQAIPQHEIDRAHTRFRRNLRTMVELCRDAEVPFLFVKPLRNPKASFYLRFHIDPSEIEDGRIDEWRDRYSRGLAAKKRGDYEQAVALLRSVRELYVEDRDEILAFYIGECLEALGRIEEARREYELPYERNPSTRILREVVDELEIPFVDPYPYIVRAAQGGIPGYAEFTDSVHPMAGTNRLIARAIVDHLRQSDTVTLRNGRRIAAAEKALENLLTQCPAPEHNLMLRAILAGNPDEAIRIALSLPENVLYQERLLEPLYLGWAYSLKGQLDKARDLYRLLRRLHIRGSQDFPSLDTDEDLIRIAFAGDVFAWF